MVQSRRSLLTVAEEMERIEALYTAKFGIEEEPSKFKGTMELVER